MDTNYLTIQTRTIKLKLLLSLAKVNFRFTLLLLILVGFSSLAWGQTTIYTTNFGTTTTLPTGWTTAGTVTWAGSTNGGTGYVGASGSGSVLHANASGQGTLTYSNNLSTIGYTNITVLWGAMRVGPNTATLQYSTNGTTWNTVTFTDAPNTASWSLVNSGTRISLPVAAENVSNLRFRWTHTSDNSPQYYYRLDDFSVQGTPVPTCPTITATVNNKTDITCFNNSDGSITVSAAGGVAPYTFSKDNGVAYVACNNLPSAGKHTFSGLSANVVYKIRVKDANNCESQIIP